MAHHFLEVIHPARDPGEIQNLLEGLLKGIKNMIILMYLCIVIIKQIICGKFIHVHYVACIITVLQNVGRGKIFTINSCQIARR
jgi:hypothetical protein